jgi:hypothetical protein
LAHPFVTHKGVDGYEGGEQHVSDQQTLSTLQPSHTSRNLGIVIEHIGASFRHTSKVSMAMDEVNKMSPTNKHSQLLSQTTQVEI